MKFSSFVNFKHVLSLIAICLLFAISAHAQGVPASISSITLSASTDNPIPGQKVTITAVSYSFDINSATIIWSINGKQVQKGIGLTTYDAKAPALGKRTTINVSAVVPDGSHFDNSITLGSGSIDLSIETDGYKPPFFKGKIDPAFQNVVKVIAFPHLADSSGKEYDPANLIYSWKKDDGTVLQDQSGYGKQSISLKGNIVPRPYYLIVTASARDGSAQAQSLIQVAPSSPSITFYNNDPLYGPLFNSAISNSLHIGSQKEVSVFASLFGFNFSSKIANDLTIDWMINNIEHSELSSSRSITLRSPDGVAGSSNVSLSIRGVNNILQSADGGLNISFDASGDTSSTPVNF